MPQDQDHNGATVPLCSSCAALPWKDLNSKDWELENVLLTIEASREDLQNRACEFCRALAAIKPPELDRSRCVLINRMIWHAGYLRYPFPVLCCKAENDKRWLVPDVWESGGLALYSSEQKICGSGDGSPEDSGSDDYGFEDSGSDDHSFRFRRVHPGRIDYAIFRDAIDYCQKNHRNCKPTADIKIRGLRVIDCHTRSVVLAPQACRYVALSYIWGPQTGSSQQERLGNDLPQVVEESFQVAVTLGYQYLWVDRYCIKSDQEKHTMIRQMDQIYSGADLTIIAAAGEDANYGLPGVGKVARTQRYELKIGDVEILQVLPRSPRLLQSTKWATRGWTYQECYLSNRRLIFTDKEVHYVCNQLHVPESVDSSFDILSIGKETPNPIGNIMPPILELSGMRFTCGDTFGQIQEYTSRQLSYDSDILDAFRGILNSFEDIGMYHLWGILLGSLGELYDQGEETTGFCLCWISRASPRRRRPGFPSWSWTGWQGAVEFLDHYQQPREGEGYIISAIFGGQNEVQLLHPEAANNISRIDRNIDPIRLRIDCQTIALYYDFFQPAPGASNDSTAVKKSGRRPKLRRRAHGFLTWFAVSATGYVGIDLESCTFLDKQPELKQRVVGVIFKWPGAYNILVVQETGDHWERVGLIKELREKLAWTDKGRVYANTQGEVLDQVTVADARAPWIWSGENRTIFLE